MHDNPHSPTQGSDEEAEQSPLVRAMNTACVWVFAALFVYLLVCVFASVWLILDVGLTDEDLRNSSYLVPLIGMHYHGLVMGSVAIAYGLIRLLVLHALDAPIVMVIGAAIILSTSQGSALRQGVLAGDVKIGCYRYESPECQKMLGEPSPSFTPAPMAYLPVISNAFPSTLPGVGFLMSPITVVLHLPELKSRIAEQRQDVADYQASIPKAESADQANE